ESRPGGRSYSQLNLIGQLNVYHMALRWSGESRPRDHSYSQLNLIRELDAYYMALHRSASMDVVPFY
ncbi:MAG: hypothetical protein OXI86_15150, partial [Candidatus Poribacteria bacterium]|nr:hypothetical protein [Candidatus Poribacteria bacterium]